MPLLPRKGVLAIAAVMDVALNSHDRPVSARDLAGRHGLPPRHLEPLLQALVHAGILRGVRGPRGGYELGRERQTISAVDILRVAAKDDDTDGDKESDADGYPAGSLIHSVVLPTLAQAEQAFAAALGQISVEQLVAEAAHRTS
jgi:Rrf2 family protein